MDALIDAAKHRGRPRDLAIFLLLRFTGMRRGSVAGLRVRHLDDTWGLRGVRQKGGKKQDIPLPAAVVRFLRVNVDRALAPECEALTPDTPLFWSSWGKRTARRTRAPMAPKNIWRLCKTYGKLIGSPGAQAPRPAPRGRGRGARATTRSRRSARAPRPCAHRHDADLREDPTAAAQAPVAFYDDEAERLLCVEAVHSAPKVSRTVDPGSRNIRMFPKPGS
jgi:integrase